MDQQQPTNNNSVNNTTNVQPSTGAPVPEPYVPTGSTQPISQPPKKSKKALFIAAPILLVALLVGSVFGYKFLTLGNNPEFVWSKIVQGTKIGVDEFVENSGQSESVDYSNMFADGLTVKGELAFENVEELEDIIGDSSMELAIKDDMMQMGLVTSIAEVPINGQFITQFDSKDIIEAMAFRLNDTPSTLAGIRELDAGAADELSDLMQEMNNTWYNLDQNVVDEVGSEFGQDLSGDDFRCSTATLESLYGSGGQDKTRKLYRDIAINMFGSEEDEEDFGIMQLDEKETKKEYEAELNGREMFKYDIEIDQRDFEDAINDAYEVYFESLGEDLPVGCNDYLTSELTGETYTTGSTNSTLDMVLWYDKEDRRIAKVELSDSDGGAVIDIAPEEGGERKIDITSTVESRYSDPETIKMSIVARNLGKWFEGDLGSDQMSLKIKSVDTEDDEPEFDIEVTASDAKGLDVANIEMTANISQSDYSGSSDTQINLKVEDSNKITYSFLVDDSAGTKLDLSGNLNMRSVDVDGGTEMRMDSGRLSLKVDSNDFNNDQTAGTVNFEVSMESGVEGDIAIPDNARDTAELEEFFFGEEL